jgi:tRNA threonylcarbamoyladenosine biosynthesis protein TsaB
VTLVLGITTSTARGEAAIVDGARVLGAASYEDLRGHAERVFAAIDEALSRARVERRAIEAIACDVGPGSFSGVRVGVASAKGIALGLGVPAIAVGSLEALAHVAFGEAPSRSLVLASISVRGAIGAAGIDELAVAVFDAALRPIASPRIVPGTEAAIAAVVAELAPSAGVRFIGAWPPNGDAPAVTPCAAAVATLGLARLRDVPRALLEPVYLRAAVQPSP